MKNKVYIGMLLLSIEMDSQSRKKVVNKLLRDMLSQISLNNKFEFYKTDNGKPILVHPKGWHYNISHSKNIAVCSISNCSIGVDIERTSSKRDYLSIAETWFHSEEIKLIGKSKVDKKKLFYHLWTRKEAWIKEKGKSVWSMKATPDMSLYHHFLRTWNVKHDTANYSMSLFMNPGINSKQKTSIDFMDSYTIPNIKITPENSFPEQPVLTEE